MYLSLYYPYVVIMKKYDFKRDPEEEEALHQLRKTTWQKTTLH